ncbi:mediator of RNA polymerase II transcription subunit 6 [Harmonia axyridis]|uniref:mediator of RNA polymerase II transcription subunit 6 n=1 Tax=Harmonia axyridis TaxID=115357 RepID=UPI001E2792AE|nr:mediator of RNA polymerase II transcription subunit 6 [Harmonia axyridis]
MMPGRLGLTPSISDNLLSLSWHDSAWIPILNTSNVMDYFSDRSNPFFDRTCNNEIVKMQRLNPDQLQNMTGLEYVLLHVQEPILYVIRKQHRHGPQPNQTTPLADYYIIAGIVYQAPDLASVLNSRLLSTVHHLQSSFEEASSFSRYHPSKGYFWDFKSQRNGNEKLKTKEEKPKEEPSSLFQRKRVDMLLGELIRKFPLPIPPLPKPAQTPHTPRQESENGNTDKDKPEVKQEKIKPPPEKKPRLN